MAKPKKYGSEDHPELTVPLINHIFGTDYSKDEEIVLLNTDEHASPDDPNGKKCTMDSFMRIRGVPYHLECQSERDGDMVVRMVQYDIRAAFKTGTKDAGKHEFTMQIPESAVLYLRSTVSTPDRMKVMIILPGGEDVRAFYYMPVVKLADISVEDIFREGLYFLIPFQIFLFEKGLEDCQKNPEKLEALVGHFENIFSRMDRDRESGKISADAVRSIVEFTQKVVESLARNEDKVVERMDEIMGGQSISYPTKVIREDERALGIQAVVRMSRRYGADIEECVSEVMSTYTISHASAMKEVIKYWGNPEV
ncbi:MAG: hypothetical protein LUC41_02435 [Clostridiales bacterium]|nr:hypothetical protein [Clostridiales bacterium]